MPKQDLLQALLASEQARLIVWLYPLDTNKRGRSLSEVSIRSAWYLRLLLIFAGESMRSATNSLGGERSNCNPLRVTLSFTAGLRLRTLAVDQSH